MVSEPGETKRNEKGKNKLKYVYLLEPLIFEVSP